MHHAIVVVIAVNFGSLSKMQQNTTKTANLSVFVFRNANGSDWHSLANLEIGKFYLLVMAM